jgi:hypothetical protein
MPWLQRLRLKVLAIVVGVTLTAIALVSLASFPAWPVAGFAVATVVVALNRLTVRLAEPVCWVCGGDLSSEPVGTHGRTCRTCGAVNQSLARRRRHGRDGARD